MSVSADTARIFVVEFSNQGLINTVAPTLTRNQLTALVDLLTEAGDAITAAQWAQEFQLVEQARGLQ